MWILYLSKIGALYSIQNYREFRETSRVLKFVFVL